MKKGDEIIRKNYSVRFFKHEHEVLKKKAEAYGYEKHMVYLREVGLDPEAFVKAKYTKPQKEEFLEDNQPLEEKCLEKGKLGKRRLKGKLSDICLTINNSFTAYDSVYYSKYDDRIEMEGKDFILIFKKK